MKRHRTLLPQTRADLTLAAAVQALTPLVPLLLREGVTYPQLAAALKTAFLEAAPDLLMESAIRLSDSSISTLTGIHRKEVRSWRSAAEAQPQRPILGAAMNVFTRWTTDPQYCEEHGRPRTLERRGGPGTFEALASSVSNDVHPRTVLQELLRLGVAELAAGAAEADEDRVRIRSDAFVPRDGAPEMLQLLSDNVGDHLAAAVQNVLGETRPMLEQSVYANKLSADSVRQLHGLARDIWHDAFQQVVRLAKARRDGEAGQPGADQRIRVGMYFFHEPEGGL